MELSIINPARHKICLALALVSLLTLTACGTTASTLTPTSSNSAPSSMRQYAVTTRFNVSYGPLPGEVLDLCLPKNASTPRPGIVLIHGGGWLGGDKHYQDSFCSYLAMLGFVAATINYRLAPSHVWPAQLVDAQLALRWLRSQANSLILDPKRICALGTSAGAHLSIFLGVLARIHPGDEAGLLSNQAPNVSCVVDEFGPTNLTALLHTNYQRSIVHALLNSATLQDNRTLYLDASPLFDVSPQSAPMLIIQGTKDTVVPPDQSLTLQQRLQQAHVPVQYISYDGEHGFQGLNQQQQNTISAQAVTYLINQEHP